MEFIEFDNFMSNPGYISLSYNEPENYKNVVYSNKRMELLNGTEVLENDACYRIIYLHTSISQVLNKYTKFLVIPDTNVLDVTGVKLIGNIKLEIPTSGIKYFDKISKLYLTDVCDLSEVTPEVLNRLEVKELVIHIDWSIGTLNISNVLESNIIGLGFQGNYNAKIIGKFYNNYTITKYVNKKGNVYNNDLDRITHRNKKLQYEKRFRHTKGIFSS